MIAPILLFVHLIAPSGESIVRQTPAIDSLLVRVSVTTDEEGEPHELTDRRESVRDLAKALAAKKKTLIVTANEGAADALADVIIEVVGRSVKTPRVVFGLAPRPGQPGATPGPVRTAVLQVRVRLGGDPIVITNTNQPFETPGGWKTAAENIADQVDKLVKEHRSEILRRRGGGLRRSRPRPAR